MCEEAGVKISHSLRVSKLFNAGIPKKMIREQKRDRDPAHYSSTRNQAKANIKKYPSFSEYKAPTRVSLLK